MKLKDLAKNAHYVSGELCDEGAWYCNVCDSPIMETRQFRDVIVIPPREVRGGCKGIIGLDSMVIFCPLCDGLPKAVGEPIIINKMEDEKANDKNVELMDGGSARV